MSIGIGIDTGGTYTDAVLYDFQENKVLAAAKSLTTKEDLKGGILAALDQLPGDLVRQAGSVALSTTLATNACVENRGGRGKLVLIGVDPEVVQRVGSSYGLPARQEILFLESKGDLAGHIIKEPDWEVLRAACPDLKQEADAVGVVELFAGKNNAVLEKKAKEIIQQETGLPVVCGFELFSDLNSIQRGASALLNARLIPVIAGFLSAVKEALMLRGIDAPVVIVRSDGSLMSEEFTGVRPIETLLCGPAASVVGGMQLSGEENCLIVDMGGTTTDIALVRQGRPVRTESGVRVGQWRTFVKGIDIDTFALGGDTEVLVQDGRLTLGTQRVVPLCVAAKQHPEILTNLEELAQAGRIHSKPLHHHFLLQKHIVDDRRYTDTERALCAALEQAALSLEEAAQALGTDVYNLRTQRLEEEGVILRCSLTPTDAMHVLGDFDVYCAKAASLGAKIVGLGLQKGPEAVCREIYDLAKTRLYTNIVRLLLADRNPAYREGLSDPLERLLLESCKQAKTPDAPSFLHSIFRTDAALVGIGAPIHVFLPDVAKMLGTRCVIPPYARVANALGAAVSNVCADCKVEVKPQCTAEGIDGYAVFGPEENGFAEELEEAVELARRLAAAGAEKEARRRGAGGKLKIAVEVRHDRAPAKDSTIYLGTTVTATASGQLSASS